MVIMEFKLNEYHRDISDEELLGDIRRIAEIVGTGRLSRSEYKKHGKYGILQQSKEDLVDGMQQSKELGFIHVW